MASQRVGGVKLRVEGGILQQRKASGCCDHSRGTSALHRLQVDDEDRGKEWGVGEPREASCSAADRHDGYT